MDALSSQQIIQLEKIQLHNYHPCRVILARKKAYKVWDVGKYILITSAYSAVGSKDIVT